MREISHLACRVDAIGTPVRFFITSLLFGLLFLFLGYVSETLLFFIALVLTVSLVGLLKIIFRVARPKNAAFVIRSFSFPSGHAAGVVFLAFGILYLVSSVVSPTTLAGLALAFIPFVALVAWSRVALHVHTVFQVFVGLLIGVSIPLVVFMYSNFFLLPFHL